MEQEQPLKFQIRLTARDLFRFSMHHANRGILGVFNVAFTALFLFLLAFKWDASSVAYRVLLLVCALMFTVWQPGLLYVRALGQSRSPLVSGAICLSLSQEGILVEQGGDRKELSWEGIGRAEKTNDLVILYMDKIHAYLIPARAMAGREKELCQLLKQKLPPEGRRGF